MKIHWRNLKSSPSELMDQFHPNLTQSILRWRGLKFFWQIRNIHVSKSRQLFFSFSQCYGRIIAFSNVFIDWNCYSGEWCGPWTSCYAFQFLDFQWFGKSSCMSSQCQTTEFMSAKGHIIHKTQLWLRDINSMMHSTYRTMASLYLLVLGESLAKTRIII